MTNLLVQKWLTDAGTITNKSYLNTTTYLQGPLALQSKWVDTKWKKQ
jgi:hypothetical protein